MNAREAFDRDHSADPVRCAECGAGARPETACYEWETSTDRLLCPECAEVDR